MDSRIGDRKNQFLNWAEEELKCICALTLAPIKTKSSSSAGDKERLREIKKTVIFSLLDTLAMAFEGGGPNKGRQAFVSLVETRGGWEDAQRISALHLGKALQVHFMTQDCSRWSWAPLHAFLVTKHTWIDGKHIDEYNIGVDPHISEICRVWPLDSTNHKQAKLKANDTTLCLWDFKHSYLLYGYRSCLVHESREQTFSVECDDGDEELEPLYMTVSQIDDQNHCEYHLVYPLRFLINLATNCINNIRANVTQDPYVNFHFGPYIISELNRDEPAAEQC